jgi:hypothetical protein
MDTSRWNDTLSGILLLSNCDHTEEISGGMITMLQMARWVSFSRYEAEGSAPKGFGPVLDENEA